MQNSNSDAHPASRSITVAQLLDEQANALDLQVLAGRTGLDRLITTTRVQKYGLAFVGYFKSFDPKRVQILGETEISYLQTLSPALQNEAISAIFSHPLCCTVVTKGLAVPQSLLNQAEERSVAVLRTALPTGEFIHRLSAYLETRLAPETTVHGVLMDVYGIGVLLAGNSGIGKSECALHLVVGGHRLVADDVVNVQRFGSVLIGSGDELLRYHMEIRGMGIINVKDLFGVASIRRRKKIELVAQLERWESGEEYERVGVEECTHTILGVEVPCMRTPVLPGRNIPTIIEVAARNQLLQLMGHHSAREFEAQLSQHLRQSDDHYISLEEEE